MTSEVWLDGCVEHGRGDEVHVVDLAHAVLVIAREESQVLHLGELEAQELQRTSESFDGNACALLAVEELEGLAHLEGRGGRIGALRELVLHDSLQTIDFSLSHLQEDKERWMSKW
eukprot:scaffold6743_cov158-Ochromonas_danica.AAC.14